MAQNQIQANQVQQITAAQFAAKYKSKKEIFTLLTVQAKAYLPKAEHVTIYVSLHHHF